MACWHKIGITWQANPSIHERIIATNATSLFMTIVIIATWELQNLLNGKIFEGVKVSMNLWTVKLEEQINRQLHRVNDDFRPIVTQ
jgi:hypothetical protein